MNPTVTALLVSHDGSRWLPQVLDRLAQQTTPPDRVVAVDTGSTDSSVELLHAGLPAGSVVVTEKRIAFPAAVRAGLAAVTAVTADAALPTDGDDWIWLLHDDSAPAPDALERLLAAADATPGVSVLGPKIREWPSLRRLLEVGVTITGTGQRETGLERSEYDQGQHDEPRDVLAVNTAGMLVRRSVLELLGFDDALPQLHTDLDFGWRAARAGHRVRTVPDAVVFHAEASRNGLRPTAQGRAARRRVEREAALYTVLANCAPAALPFVAVRLLLGTLLRALGLLLVRAPGESAAELCAAGSTLLRPRRLLHARSRRRASAELAPSQVRRLLPPAWLPYRHGLDELGAIAAAVVGEAGVRTGATEGGPSFGARLARRPSVWVLVLLTVLSLAAARDLLGDGRLAGGALLPAPGSASVWWRDYLGTTHDIATGSTATAPAYLLPLAVIGTLLLGSASAAVDLLVLGAVPLAGAGGYRFLRKVTDAAAPSAWGAVGYALLLATSGALAEGRIGTLVAATVLPWLATSALGLASGSSDRRRRAAWRCSLWLALAAAFAPLAWLLAVGVTFVGIVAALTARRAVPGVAVVPLLASAVLLLPWSALVWSERGWSAALLEAGLPRPGLVDGFAALDLVSARASDVGSAPAWVAAAVGLLALLALVRTDARGRVLLCWTVALAGLVAVWLLNGVEAAWPATGVPTAVWVGLPLLLVHGAWITATAVAAAGLRELLARRTVGWRQPLALLAVGLGLILPMGGAAWWVAAGSDDPLTRVSTADVPVYMDDAAARDRRDGTLVLRGGLQQGITAEVRRGAPLTLGQETFLPSVDRQRGLTDAVTDLVTAPTPDAVETVARSGVAHVFLPAPVDPDLAAALDAVPALAPASADAADARAWRLDGPTPEVDVPAATSPWLRPLLLVAQALALLVVLVLAAPTRKAAR